jgi:predicted aldo/keto reductase-like oxidoreductase
LGNTGVTLPLIGFGGLIVRDTEQGYANNLVAKAFERGVNYFDVAPTYGNAEDILGPALLPLRNKSFLACKTTQRDKVGSEKELNESLAKLKTDHFDLYQLHGLKNIDEAEKSFAANGAMETFLKAKQDGKIRFIGFSAHSEEVALFAMEQFEFDTILFPVNFICWFQGNFGISTIAKAKEKSLGILALKSLAFTYVPQGKERPHARLWYQPIDDAETANLALRFALSQGTTAAIPPGDELFFWKAVEIAEKFSLITEEETEKLKKLSEGVVPIFKTS